MSSSAKSSKGLFPSPLTSKTGMRKKRRGSALASSRSSRRSRQGKRRMSSLEVSQKLESLRNLIPAGRNSGGEEDVAAPATDRLFQETADYIVRLKAQVVVLQRLIQLYGCDSSESGSIPSAVL